MDAARSKLTLAALAVIALALASLFVGVGDLHPGDVLSDGEAGAKARELVLVSRLPRSLSLLIAGASLAVCGMVMQMLARNRFVEPTTAGATDAAALGMLCATILAPGLPALGKMGVAALFSLAGAGLFMALLRAAPLRSAALVPLVGLMLGDVIGAASMFLAYGHDLTQALAVWRIGDFSTVLRGRYELLWIGAGLAAAVYFVADRFTIAGLGRDVAQGLGLDHTRALWLGLGIVALVTANVVATVGTIPFLGLVAPNLVSLAIGDNLRRALPWVALAGAGLILACDILGRLVVFPYEVPVGVTMGVIGAGVFLTLLLRGRARAG